MVFQLQRFYFFMDTVIEFPEKYTQGSLAETPLWELLLALFRSKKSGKLCIGGQDRTQSILFLKDGEPVGVELAEFFVPLGQLLLELGLIDSNIFIEAQKLIVLDQRLAGQIYQSAANLSIEEMKRVFDIQAHRKMIRFCQLREDDFSFHEGLSELIGFHGYIAHIEALIYLALRHHMGSMLLEEYHEKIQSSDIILQNEPTDLWSILARYHITAPAKLWALLQSAREPTDYALAELSPPQLTLWLRYLELLEHVQLQERSADKTNTQAQSIQAASVKKDTQTPEHLSEIVLSEVIKPPPLPERKSIADEHRSTVLIPSEPLPQFPDYFCAFKTGLEIVKKQAKTQT
jgi:hypothetical protein